MTRCVRLEAGLGLIPCIPLVDQLMLANFEVSSDDNYMTRVTGRCNPLHECEDHEVRDEMLPMPFDEAS